MSELDQRQLEAERFWQHSRLHCIKKALGDEDGASVHFAKMRYWWLALREGDSSWSTSKLAEKLRSYTEYRSDSKVVWFDNGHTNGKGARFWQELAGGPISPDDWLKATYGVQ